MLFYVFHVTVYLPVLFNLLLPDEESLIKDEDDTTQPEDEANPAPCHAGGHQGIGPGGLIL